MFCERNNSENLWKKLDKFSLQEKRLEEDLNQWCQVSSRAIIPTHYPLLYKSEFGRLVFEDTINSWTPNPVIYTVRLPYNSLFLAGSHATTDLSSHSSISLSTVRVCGHRFQIQSKLSNLA